MMPSPAPALPATSPPADLASPSDPEVAAFIGRVRDQVIASLRSDLCPGCGGTKPEGKSVCRRRCWAKLRKHLRDDLYRRVGEGYEEALAAALNFLGATTPHMPAVRRRKGGRS